MPSTASAPAGTIPNAGVTACGSLLTRKWEVRKIPEKNPAVFLKKV
jgi:hypothetical protein